MCIRDSYRYSLDKIENLVERAIDKKIPMIALFPQISKSKKKSPKVCLIPRDTMTTRHAAIKVRTNGRKYTNKS